MQFGQYHVHRTSKEPQDSAAMLAEIDRRIEILSKYLNNKYGCKTCVSDVVGGNDGILGKNIIIKYNMYARTQQLVENYNGSHLYEISPNNLMGNTSFTEDKGRKIVMCLRDKSTGQLHDINTIMFVALHEITHVMNNRWGHESYFWELFRIILQNSAECGIYVPINYSITPVRYCGLDITQNPLFV